MNNGFRLQFNQNIYDLLHKVDNSVSIIGSRLDFLFKSAVQIFLEIIDFKELGA